VRKGIEHEVVHGVAILSARVSLETNPHKIFCEAKGSDPSETDV